MAKKSNQKIKLLYLMKILLENTDDEHGMTLAEISDALGSVCSGSISTREKAKA